MRNQNNNDSRPLGGSVFALILLLAGVQGCASESAAQVDVAGHARLGPSIHPLDMTQVMSSSALDHAIKDPWFRSAVTWCLSQQGTIADYSGIIENGRYATIDSPVATMVGIISGKFERHAQGEGWVDTWMNDGLGIDTWMSSSLGIIKAEKINRVDGYKFELLYVLHIKDEKRAGILTVQFSLISRDPPGGVDPVYSDIHIVEDGVHAVSDSK